MGVACCCRLLFSRGAGRVVINDSVMQNTCLVFQRHQRAAHCDDERERRGVRRHTAQTHKKAGIVRTADDATDEECEGD